MTRRIIIAVVALVAAAATLNAQPEHNDTLRTVTWSIYAQGGISGFHGMRGPEGQYTYDKWSFAPAADVGFFLYPRPWIRFGLGGNYTYLKQADEGVRQFHETLPNYVLNIDEGTYVGTMDIETVRIQNRNFTHLIGADLTMGINFMEIWRERKAQWFNIWATIGAGYIYGWNTWARSLAIDKHFVSNDKMVVFSNSELDSPITKNIVSAPYVPLGLSMEFDIIPQLSLAIYGQYKYFPMNLNNTPTGIWSAGAGLRFNLVGRKQGLKNKNDKINELREQVKYYSNLPKADTVVVEVPVEKVVEVPVEVRVEVPVEVPVTPAPRRKLVEVDKPLSHFAVQIYAFRIYQHAPDDEIFFDDYPTIYRNGDLRRYVVFAGTLEEAKEKWRDLRTRYYDAFIVFIDDDGTVVPYVE